MNNQKRLCVRDVMKPKYDMVDGMTTVSDALRKMRYIETKSLIVDKRDDNDEYGMVMLADIARQVLARDRSPERINIYEVMSKPVLTVHPEMDIRYCARLFDRFGLSRAPVVNGNNIVGIVSLTDMVLKGMCGD